MTRSRWMLVAAAAVVSSLGTAGCMEPGPEPEAGAGVEVEEAPEVAVLVEAPPEARAEEARAEIEGFEACLREHGLEPPGHANASRVTVIRAAAPPEGDGTRAPAGEGPVVYMRKAGGDAVRVVDPEEIAALEACAPGGAVRVRAMAPVRSAEPTEP